MDSSLIERIRQAARFAAAVGIGHATIGMHGVSYEDAATLWMAGCRPHAYTGQSWDGKWETWHSMTVEFDDVRVNAFTVHRPALQWEIDAEHDAVTGVAA